MPCYAIHYLRKDMPIPCVATKHAHTPKEALAHLAAGNDKKGYSIKLTGGRSLPIQIIEIKEKI